MWPQVDVGYPRGHGKVDTDTFGHANLDTPSRRNTHDRHPGDTDMHRASLRPRREVIAPTLAPSASSSQAAGPTRGPRFSTELSPGSLVVPAAREHRRAHTASMHPNTRYLVSLLASRRAGGSPLPHLRPKDPLSPGLNLPGPRPWPRGRGGRLGPEPSPLPQGPPRRKYPLSPPAPPPSPPRPGVDGPRGPAPNSLPTHLSPLFSLLGFSVFPNSRGQWMQPPSQAPAPRPHRLLSGCSILLVFILCKKKKRKKFQQKPKAGAPGSPRSPPPPAVGPVGTENFPRCPCVWCPATAPSDCPALSPPPLPVFVIKRLWSFCCKEQKEKKKSKKRQKNTNRRGKKTTKKKGRKINTQKRLKKEKKGKKKT